MTKKLIYAVVTIGALVGSTAFAENINVTIGPAAAPQQPYDYGHLNASPIQGKGRISVVHNEPAPGDPDAELTKAMWLLKDNGWQVSKPNPRRQ